MKCKKTHTLELPEVETSVETHWRLYVIWYLTFIHIVAREATIREDDELFMLPSMYIPL